MTNYYHHSNDFFQAALMLTKLDATRTAAYDLASRVQEDGGVKPTPEEFEQKRQASNQEMRDSVYGKGPIRGAKDAISSAASNIAGRAQGAASGAKDAVMGTPGGEEDQRMQNLMNRKGSPVQESTKETAGTQFQGTPGMAQNASSSLQGAVGTAKDWAGEKKGQATDAMTSAAEKIGQGYSNMASNVVPKVDATMQGAAEKIGQGVDSAKTWAGDMNTKYNTPENRAAITGKASEVATQAKEGLWAGAKKLAGSPGKMVGRMAYGAVDPATGQRTGRDASGFINPNDKLGTVGAGIKGALTGQGATNAIEQRNQNRLSTNDLDFDRNAQTNLKQGVQSANAEKRWAGMPGNVHEGMGIAGQAPAAAPTQAAAPTPAAAPAATPTPGDADGNGIPDVEETHKTTTDGTTGEVKETLETKVTPVETTPAATATASSGGGGMSSGGGGMSSGGGGMSSGQPSQSNKIAENALAAQQAGKLSDANKRAGKSWSDGGVGTGIASNALTLGGAGVARHAANALTRRGGKKDVKAAQTSLQGMTGANPTFTASSDSPLDNYWGLQKMKQDIRMRDTTEAIRYGSR